MEEMVFCYIFRHGVFTEYAFLVDSDDSEIALAQKSIITIILTS